MEERLARLTPRERQVCDLVIKGLLNKQIGAELGMTEKTVKVHRGQVMRKLEVHSVAALVRLFADLPESLADLRLRQRQAEARAASVARFRPQPAALAFDDQAG